MREIKLRCWVENRMVNFYCLTEFVTWMYSSTDACEALISLYTGLKDRNGKEIYEGDIILDDFMGINYEIRYEDGCFVYGDTTLLCKDSIYEYEIEVIGNIFENPELL